jgi:hypothetical protein
VSFFVNVSPGVEVSGEKSTVVPWGSAIYLLYRQDDTPIHEWLRFNLDDSKCFGGIFLEWVDKPAFNVLVAKACEHVEQGAPLLALDQTRPYYMRYLQFVRVLMRALGDDPRTSVGNRARCDEAIRLLDERLSENAGT